MASDAASVKRTNFKWTGKMVEDLIHSIDTYKTSMEFKNLYFNADKSAQYAFVREVMAGISEDENLLGLATVPSFPSDYNELTAEQQLEERKQFKRKNDLIKRGRNRIMEKTKEIRQSFSKAVISGSHSRSGKVVFEHYDLLVKIWGGAASTQSLAFGISSSSNASLTNDNGCADDNDESLSNGTTENHENETESDNEADAHDLAGFQLPAKRKSVVPKLVDNKRKHLEKHLSAAQRDQLMIRELKEDAGFRHDLIEVVKESNNTFASSITEISKSISDLSKGLCSSMDLLSRTLASQMQPQTHMQHQNIYYQQNPHNYNDTMLPNAANQQGSYYSNLLNEHDANRKNC